MQYDPPLIYLIRYSQAGPRGNYDELSTLGQQQAQQLGQYFGQHQIRFDAIYTGGLQRQQRTAHIVQAHLSARPEIITDERWNEFKFGAVYQSLSAHLCAESDVFARDFAEIQTTLGQDGYALSRAVVRCDRAVIRAWLEHRYPALEYKAGPVAMLQPGGGAGCIHRIGAARYASIYRCIYLCDTHRPCGRNRLATGR